MGQDPIVFLAHNMKGQGENAIVDPTVFLALGGFSGDKGSPAQNHILATQDPTVYLAHQGPTDARAANHILEPKDGGEVGVRGGRLIEKKFAPALLVSYVYVKKFIEHQARYRYRYWILDSGAFSAFNSGTVIDLQAYTEFCQERLAQDPTLREVFALDVIGDWKASRTNAEAMWKAGVPAIPAYHCGSPESELVSLCQEYPKIGLGGIKGKKRDFKMSWCKWAFSKVWPARLHGFAIGSRDLVMALPWHSVDATNWESGPARFGRWNAFGGALPVRGSHHDLRIEIEWYWKLEQDARERWADRMAELRSLPSSWPRRTV